MGVLVEQAGFLDFAEAAVAFDACGVLGVDDAWVDRAKLEFPSDLADPFLLLVGTLNRRMVHPVINVDGLLVGRSPFHLLTVVWVGPLRSFRCRIGLGVVRLGGRDGRRGDGGAQKRGGDEGGDYQGETHVVDREEDWLGECEEVMTMQISGMRSGTCLLAETSRPIPALL